MQTKRKRPAPGEGTSRKYKQKFFNRPIQVIRIPKKNKQEGTLEPFVKSWAADRLMERFFDGSNTPETRHASRFWMRSCGGLKNA